MLYLVVIFLGRNVCVNVREASWKGNTPLTNELGLILDLCINVTGNCAAQALVSGNLVFNKY